MKVCPSVTGTPFAKTVPDGSDLILNTKADAAADGDDAVRLNDAVPSPPMVEVTGGTVGGETMVGVARFSPVAS